MEQKSDAWFAARCGKATGSRIADIIAKTKSGYSTSRANYMAQLVTERMTGTVAESYSNAAMLHGTLYEPEARNAYAFERNLEVEELGFVIHPLIIDSGASPDGLVGDKGMVEIKCPLTATHIDTLLNDTIADKYIVQMQWQMACAERDWCDFVSYDPRMPLDMQLYVRRIDRDPARIAELESEVQAFLGEVSETIGKLRARYAPSDSTTPNPLMAG